MQRERQKALKALKGDKAEFVKQLKALAGKVDPASARYDNFMLSKSGGHLNALRHRVVREYGPRADDTVLYPREYAMPAELEEVCVQQSAHAQKMFDALEKVQKNDYPLSPYNFDDPEEYRVLSDFIQKEAGMPSPQRMTKILFDPSDAGLNTLIEEQVQSVAGILRGIAPNLNAFYHRVLAEGLSHAQETERWRKESIENDLRTGNLDGGRLVNNVASAVTATSLPGRAGRFRIEVNALYADRYGNNPNPLLSLSTTPQSLLHYFHTLFEKLEGMHLASVTQRDGRVYFDAEAKTGSFAHALLTQVEGRKIDNQIHWVEDYAHKSSRSHGTEAECRDSVTESVIREASRHGLLPQTRFFSVAETAKKVLDSKKRTRE